MQVLVCKPSEYGRYVLHFTHTFIYRSLKKPPSAITKNQKTRILFLIKIQFTKTIPYGKIKVLYRQPDATQRFLNFFSLVSFYFLMTFVFFKTRYSFNQFLEWNCQFLCIYLLRKCFLLIMLLVLALVLFIYRLFVECQM